MGEKSSEIAKRVQAAVKIQQHRYKETKIRRNSMLPAEKTNDFCPMNEKAEKALHTAISKLSLSGRAYHGVLRVARTIADLESKEILEVDHVLEAVHHRRFGEDPMEILSMKA